MLLLLGELGVFFGHECIAGFIGYTREVEFKGKALFESVASLYIHGSMPLSDALAAQYRGAFLGEILGHFHGFAAQLFPGHHRKHGTIVVKLLSGCVFAGVNHGAHFVLWNKRAGGWLRPMRRVHFRQTKYGVVRGNDDVGVAYQANSAADTKSIDGGNTAAKAA